MDKLCKPLKAMVYLNFFPPQNNEVLGSPHHKAHEFVAEQLLDLIGLLDGDRDADGVDGGLDQNAFLLVPRDDDRIEKQLRRFLDFDLRFVVTLHFLRREVLQAHGGLERPLHRQQIRFQSGRLKLTTEK